MSERIYWLAWSQVPNVGPIALQRMRSQFGTLAAAWSAPLSEVMAVSGVGEKIGAAIAEKRPQIDPEPFYRQHLQENPHFWTPDDEDYPRLLLETPSPPPVLYYRGTVNLDENQGYQSLVAIVGTRDPTEYGLRWTRKVSSTLARHGFTIVSGMALGIDAAAHEGCLDAGGRTLAALGTGVDLVYPPAHSSLYQKILDRGLVISEYPAGTKPAREHFPNRNRVIAGWSRAVLVMEAPSKSGALITARFANDFGREVYVLPGSLDNSQAIGCLGLLHHGAQVILNESLLLEMLGAMPQLELFDSPAALAPPSPDLAPELAQVLSAIAGESMPFDLVVERSQLSAAAVSSALLQLELLGLVSQLPGMRYRRI